MVTPKIEMGVKEIDGNTGLYHAFVVMTLSDGSQYILRGGPKDGHSFTDDFYAVGADQLTEYSEQTKNITYDWDYRRDNIPSNDGNNGDLKFYYQEQVHGTDAEMRAIFAKMQAVGSLLNRSDMDYEHLQQNSNTFIAYAFSAAGIKPIIPLKENGDTISLTGFGGVFQSGHNFQNMEQFISDRFASTVSQFDSLGAKLSNSLPGLLADLNYLAHAAYAAFTNGYSGNLSPIVLDLDHDGFELTTTDSGTFFDLNNDGFAERAGWVNTDDSLLVHDLNGNGAIDNQHELFGTDSVSTAYEKLSTLDTNADGKIGSNDVGFGDLRVWRDLNHDGYTQEGELFTLPEVGVSALSLSKTNSGANIAGNTLDWQATWYTNDANGNATVAGGSFGDVFFATNQANSKYVGDDTNLAQIVSYDSMVLPWSRGYGTVKSFQLEATEHSEVLAKLQAVADLGISDLSQANHTISDFLYEWAGVSTVSREGGTEYYNPQEMAFLEKIFNYDYTVPSGNGVGEQFPIGKDATAAISDSEAMVWMMLKTRLMVQGPLHDVFDHAAYDIGTDKIEFHDTLTNVLATAISLAPEDAQEKQVYWQEIGQVLVVNADEFGGDVSAIKSQLNTAAGTTIHVLENWILGKESADNFIASQYADSIEAGSGNDTIRSGGGDDSMLGQSGNDSLYGGVGDDTLVGGLGNDTLLGEQGNDTFLYAIGDGAERILDDGGSYNSSDKLIISGYNYSSATFSRVANTTDFKISFNGSSTDYIIVQRGIENGYATFESVQFADGITRDTNQIRADIFAGQSTEGNDTIDGWSWTENNIIGKGGNDGLTGSVLNDTLSGDAGNDTLNGYSGNDDLTGGTGNDSLMGGAGQDTYHYAIGDGADTIYDGGNLNEADNLIITGYDMSAAIFSRVGNTNDIKINFVGSSTDSILITDGFENGNDTFETISFANGGSKNVADLRIEVISNQATAGNDTIVGWGSWSNTVDGLAGNDSLTGGSSGDILSGGVGNDTVKGDYGNDTIAGNAGNDSMVGGVGNDTFVYTTGDGADTINDNGGVNQTDTLQISGYDLASTIFTRVNNTSDFKLTFVGTTTDSITIKNGLEDNASTFELVTFANGDTRTLSQIRDEVMTKQITTGNDTITGWLNVANTIHGDAGNDSLYGGLQADTLSGDAGNDTLMGDGGNDSLIGGLGSDSLKGGDGDDYYSYHSGDGADTVFESASTNGNDTLHIDGYDLNSAVFSRVGNSTDFKITFNGSATDSITIQYGLDPVTNTLETVNFASGGSKTVAELRVDVLNNQCTTGNDTIVGWTFQANTISGNSGNDSITSSGYADSLSGDAGNDTILGGGGNDTITGGTGNDSLTGDSGNDIINGSVGVDTLTGGAGNDIFTFSSLTDSVHTGNGYDYIKDFVDGADKISLAGLGFNHITTNSTTTDGELRLIFDSVANKTFIHSDQNGFEVSLLGDCRAVMSDTDFIFS
ncbi:MAG: calcium-binding protein [Alphaproteobacteria bacterium]|nr:calcium-binding protein [Alphaproteobacteria bacterium]